MTDSAAPASPAEAFERLWAEVQLLLEWREGFAFYLVLGDDFRMARRLRERIEDFCVTRCQPLQWVRPEQAATLVETVLQAVLPGAAEVGPAHPARSQAPLWLELTAEPGKPEWDEARRKALSALNRQRAALERDCQRPLFLHLPPSMAAEVVVWAPDLWSIRGLIATLPDDVPELRASADSLRQRSIELTDEGDTEREQGHLESALRIYRQNLALNQQRRARFGDTPQVLRDLSISLDRVGNAERDSGRFEPALSAYRDSLALCQQLRQSLGDTPQVLRDLSVSLNKVGNAERDSGRLEPALSAYRESLALRQQLRQALGDSWRVLNDLGYVLQELAHVERTLGLNEDAQAHEEELQRLQALLAQRP